MPDGPARLGDQPVIVSEGSVRLRDGTLAGSAASLPECLRFLRSATGCTTAEAIGTCTTVPAAAIGDPLRGTLAAGARGDLTLLDADLDVAATIVGGELLYDRRTDGARHAPIRR
jgi:N-acetylglucosamine-6-phosphate deacetylase